MDQRTRDNFIRFYATLSDEDLAQNKLEIGEQLKHGLIKNIDEIKEVIAIINNEIKIRLERGKSN